MTIDTETKPDFSCGGGGMVNPEVIPASVRSELRLNLKDSRLTDEQKEDLLDYANVMGQVMMNGEPEPGKLQRKQIKAIEANAKRLLKSLASLGQPALAALHAHTGYLAYGSAPPIELGAEIKSAIKQPGGSLLSSAWDWVEALEKASQYAAAQYSISKQSKPSQMRARGYVAMLAKHVCELTGALPPKDPASWFTGFAECLGRHHGLEISTRIVASGIGAES